MLVGLIVKTESHGRSIVKPIVRLIFGPIVRLIVRPIVKLIAVLMIVVDK